jgi:acyl-CoA dehydrogenase
LADRTFLDWPFFTDAHRELAAALEAWCGRVLAALPHPEPSDGHAAAEEATRARVRALGDGGWLEYSVVAPHGGRAERLDVRALCLCRETLARHDPLADFAFAMQGLGSGPISLFGSDEQRARFLPAGAAGRAVAAFALSEEQAGSDLGGLTTAARADGDDFVLDGAKTWISNAGVADHYVVFARMSGDTGGDGLTAFVVEADRPGLAVAERLETLSPHPLGSLAFDGCRVPRANLLGAAGDGLEIALATLDVFRSTVGAAALGMARRALEASVERVRERRIGGRPLADRQITQAKLADMALAVDSAALLVYRAAWAKDASGGGRTPREAAMAKLAATEAAQRVIDEAVQLHGGSGVVRGSVPETLYREIRALRIYEGTSEIQRLIIARQVLAE